MGPLARAILADGNLLIRDPWEGTRYQLTQAEFKDSWTFEAVYRTGKVTE